MAAGQRHPRRQARARPSHGAPIKCLVKPLLRCHAGQLSARHAQTLLTRVCCARRHSCVDSAQPGRRGRSWRRLPRCGRTARPLVPAVHRGRAGIVRSRRGTERGGLYPIPSFRRLRVGRRHSRKHPPLPAWPVQKHEYPPGQRLRDVDAQVVGDQGQRQVDPGGDPWRSSMPGCRGCRAGRPAQPPTLCGVAASWRLLTPPGADPDLEPSSWQHA